MTAAGRVSGKVALVTGAAQGIGRRAGAALAAEGAAVLVTDIADDAGERVAVELRASGADASYARLDVSVEADWALAVETCRSRHGAPTVLVSNAFRTSYAPLLEETIVGWDDTIGLMLRGTFLGLQAVVPEMQAAGGGSVIVIGSNFALRGADSGAAYQAAKGALRMLTKHVAATYAADGIRANCLHPGAVRTEGVVQNGLVELQDAFVARSLLRRPARPEEIAPLILYLASDESAYATGADFVIDGGLTAV